MFCKMKTNFLCFSPHNRNWFYIILSSAAVLSGGLIYVLRVSEPVFFQWIKDVGLNNWLNIARRKTVSVPQHFPEWFIYSLPNGLWAFAYALLITGIWSGSKSWLRIFWMASIPVLVLGFEFLQYVRIIPGTFCIQDIILGITGMTTGILIGILTFKSKSHEKEGYHLLGLIISMAGYVPKNATVLRTITMVSSLSLAIYLSNYQPRNSDLAMAYFILSEVFYLGFITIVLSKNGLRHWFIRKWGSEDEGYLIYEALLGFLFFHNGVSIGYIASSSPDTLFRFINKDFLFIIVLIMFISGLSVKIWAAKIVTIEIYYWKDMFLGKEISGFIQTGPYKYFKNPMYGIGQLPAYATAIWYGSKYGLIAACINQVLIFSFYYLIEKKFIERIYHKSVL